MTGPTAYCCGACEQFLKFVLLTLHLLQCKHLHTHTLGHYVSHGYVTDSSHTPPLPPPNMLASERPESAMRHCQNLNDFRRSIRGARGTLIDEYECPLEATALGPPRGTAPARRVHESGLHITLHIWALRPTAWHNQNPAYWQQRSVRSPSTHATATDSGSSAATPICSIPQMSTTMLNDPASIHISNTSCAPTQALLKEGT